MKNNVSIARKEMKSSVTYKARHEHPGKKLLSDLKLILHIPGEKLLSGIRSHNIYRSLELFLI